MQVDSGGLNGRPEKQADVCYSWWVLSSLGAIGRINWINSEKLAEFIVRCQDDIKGGIADRPGDEVSEIRCSMGLLVTQCRYELCLWFCVRRMSTILFLEYVDYVCWAGLTKPSQRCHMQKLIQYTHSRCMLSNDLA